MVRWEKERPFHGEATAYTDGANKITENKKAVNDQLAKAKGAYESGFYREGLLQLSDALHTAEDRGSHGDGMPWSGHDPRLKMPLKWDGTPNENYREGWDCDNPGKNPGGRELGEYFATETFEKFLQDLNFESKLKVAMGIGAKKTSFNWGRDWGSRIFHNFRTFGLGTLFGAVGGKVLEPSEDVVRDLDEYQKIKAAYPSVDIKQLLQFANQGERGTESAQGFASYKTEHLKQVRDTVKNQLIQIIQGVQGNMDPFAMESQYKMFSKLQAMSREYDAAIAGVDPKSTERDLGAQLIEQDAADWKDKANKYSSLIRKIVRIGRNAERETLKASILDRAPEHLNFVNGQIALASR